MSENGQIDGLRIHSSFDNVMMNHNKLCKTDVNLLIRQLIVIDNNSADTITFCDYFNRTDFENIKIV